jgi:hypothetical protein
MEKAKLCLYMAKFPNIFEAELKEGIFVDTQTKQIFEDNDYSTKLNVTEKKRLGGSWKHSQKFLDNELEEKCSLIFQYMISYLSVNKPHFLLSHTDYFPKTWQPSPINLATCSNRTFPNGKEVQWERV